MNFVDLFSGGGMGARGAVRAGGNPVLAVDSWDIAAETYRDNFPSCRVICDSIGELKPEELATQVDPVDVLLTSPECTSHSIARGSRPGSEESRATALGIVPWLDAFQPRWLIVENVNRMKKWGRHAHLLESIRDREYKINDLYLNSADFGVGQTRKRMFLVCSSEGHTITAEGLQQHSHRRAKTADRVINWKAGYRTSPLYKPGRAKATLERAEKAMKTLGTGVPFIIVYYGSDQAGGWQSLDVPLRTVTTLDRFGLVTWPGNEPHMRMLQPDELLKAMSAGPEHRLRVGTRRDKVKLCGNGVCAHVMEAIFNWMRFVEEEAEEDAA